MHFSSYLHHVLIHNLPKKINEGYECCSLEKTGSLEMCCHIELFWLCTLLASGLITPVNMELGKWPLLQWGDFSLLLLAGRPTQQGNKVLHDWGKV